MRGHPMRSKIARQNEGISPSLKQSWLRRDCAREEGPLPTVPGVKQYAADQNKCDAKSRPEPRGAPTNSEAQKATERQAQEPVERHRTNHRRARIARTSQGARRNGL